MNTNIALKTENESFIKMWRHLQRNNIENNLFMLKTNDLELKDFSISKYNNMDRDDPYFPIYRNKIVNEVKENIWFYFREIVMIPDENDGYKHFELTPESMMMIYLYDKNKSFINIDNHDDICLKFLWNYHRELYGSDIVLCNTNENIKSISNDIKKHLSNMDCQVILGHSQIASDDMNRILVSNLNSFKEYFLKKSDNLFRKHIAEINNLYISNNSDVKNNTALFILEKDIPLITYSYIIDYINSDYRLYLNGISDKMSIDRIILNNFLTAYFPKVDDSIYDKDNSELNYLYLI